jgi:GNAT superfamily N-acetyltransferase
MPLIALTETASLRSATPADDDSVARMSVSLYREDPGSRAVDDADVRATLAHLRAHPDRGAAYVVEAGGVACGYAFIVAFWSNELGGLIAFVDELYLEPAHRGAGVAAAFFAALMRGAVEPFARLVAVDLEVTTGNPRARALYERLGFAPHKNAHLRWRPGASLER